MVAVTSSNKAQADDCPAPSKLVLKEVVPSKVVEREVVKESAPARIVEREVTTDPAPTKTYVVQREVSPSTVVVEREVNPTYSTVVEREVNVDPSTVVVRHHAHFRPLVERDAAAGDSAKWSEVERGVKPLRSPA